MTNEEIYLSSKESSVFLFSLKGGNCWLQCEKDCPTLFLGVYDSYFITEKYEHASLKGVHLVLLSPNI